MYKECLQDAENLVKGNFRPAIDDLENETVDDVMYKVLIEWDLAEEGEINVTKTHINKVEQFFRKWRKHVDPSEQGMYKSF